jgi:hypothetical protein
MLSVHRVVHPPTLGAASRVPTTADRTGPIAGEASNIGEPDQGLDSDRSTHGDDELMHPPVTQLRHPRRECVLEPSDRSASPQCPLPGAVSASRSTLSRIWATQSPLITGRAKASTVVSSRPRLRAWVRKRQGERNLGPFGAQAIDTVRLPLNGAPCLWPVLLRSDCNRPVADGHGVGAGAGDDGRADLVSAGSVG